MATEARIKTCEVADDTGLRSLEISIGRNKIMTPSKSFGPEMVSSKQPFSHSGLQFNEIYALFKEDTITTLSSDRKKNTAKNKKMQQKVDNGIDSPSITFIDYVGKQNGCPTIPHASEIEMLTNFAYTFSDITPIPAIPKIASSLTLENADLFIQYIQNCIESIEVWNYKPIMGYLPIGSLQPILERLINLYLDNGINTFYLDYNLGGLAGSKTNVTALKRVLSNRGYNENHCFYVLNMKYGKVQKENSVLPARDFLGLGLGLDNIGNSHRTRPVPPHVAKEMVPVSKKFRVLNRNEYGYYRVDIPNISNGIHYPPDSPISLNQIVSTASQEGKRRLVEQVNLHEQTAECLTLQQIISEEKGHTFHYFQSKSCLDAKDLKILARR